jgi:hypothetical protein
VDSYHGLCGWVLGNFGLHAVFVGAGRSADLLAVRIVSSFLGLHLAEFATKEINCAALESVNAFCSLTHSFSRWDTEGPIL